MAGNARTKQEALNRLCLILDAEPMELSRGSTIPAEIFYLAARRVGIDPARSMPEIGEAIARAAGLEWGTDCDSRHTPSRGGSTVTLVGMNRLIDALEILQGARVAPEPGRTSFGQPYIEARGGIEAPATAVTHDWDALDRATRAHADLQNRLADLVRSRGLGPVTPRPGIDPGFDVGWRCAHGLVVAEVKTVTPQNRRQQVRLGLGQVLDYRWHLTQTQPDPVLGVLATSEPMSEAEASFCTASGITPTWPDIFEESLGPLLAAP